MTFTQSVGSTRDCQGSTEGYVDSVDDILEVANVVAGLPSLDQVKAEILGLIDSIVIHLNSLKA